LSRDRGLRFNGGQNPKLAPLAPRRAFIRARRRRHLRRLALHCCAKNLNIAGSSHEATLKRNQGEGSWCGRNRLPGASTMLCAAALLAISAELDEVTEGA